MTTETVSSLDIHNLSWSENLDAYLTSWKNNIALRRRSHLKMAWSYRNSYYGLGIPPAIIQAFVSAGIFSTLEISDSSTSLYIRIIIGILSACGLAISAISVIVNPQKTGEQHAQTAKSHEALYS